MAGSRTEPGSLRPLAHRRRTAGNAPVGALPIVLLHGLAGTQGVWAPVVDELTAHGDVITVDLPGFGASDAVADEWTLEHAAAAVHATLDAIGVDRCVLVGHSLGGGVAIVTALERPERVESLVLVSPAGFGGGRRVEVSARAAQLHAIWRMAARPVAAPALRVGRLRNAIFRYMVHDTTSIDARGAAQLARGAMQGRNTLDARVAIVAADLLPRLRELTMPVRIVWGRADRVTPAGMAPEVARRIRDVQLDMLDDVGHLPMWEQPAAVVAAIADAAKGRQGNPLQAAGASTSNTSGAM